MKKTIGKYLFEIIVIFIGITSSFLFEEWRQDREKDKRASEIMKALLVELERNDSFIREIDTVYMDATISIQNLLDNEEVTQPEVTETSYMLLEGISQVRLKEIASFIHGFSSNDHIDIISMNKDVLRYLTYMESLLTEHELTTNTLTNSNYLVLWPLLNKYGLTNEIINQQKELIDLDQVDPATPNINITKYLTDLEVRKQLKFSQLKLLRLIQINQAIHSQIENITNELNQAIKKA